jgi:hypothetical protein
MKPVSARTPGGPGVTRADAAKFVPLLLESRAPGPAIPFPTAADHRAACDAFGLCASDPDTWSAERRRRLRRDLEQRLRARRTTAPAVRLPATKPLGLPKRRTADNSVEAAS